MRYILLIYGDEEAASAEEYHSSVMQADVISAYREFGRKVEERGIKIDGDALESVKTATTVRVRGGDTLVTDGPFAETKEQLGGFYIVDCKDLDEAIEIASWIPGAAQGSIEVRPLMHFG